MTIYYLCAPVMMLFMMRNVILIGQCYRDLGQKSQARKMCDAATSMETISKEVGTDCSVTGLCLCSEVLVFSH